MAREFSSSKENPELNQSFGLSFSSAVTEILQSDSRQIIVTGATGWLGMASLSMLSDAMGAEFDKRVTAYGAAEKRIVLRDRQIRILPLSELSSNKCKMPLLLHLAFITRERTKDMSSLDFMRRNIEISETVEKFANLSRPSGLFLPSSGAVHLEMGDDPRLTNPYGFLKFQDENTFGSMFPNLDKAAIIRIFNISGPFLHKSDTFALSKILKEIEQSGVVRIESDYYVRRSYVYVGEVVELAFQIMLGLVNSPNTPFDTRGSEVIEIEELAARCIKVLGKMNIRIERPEIDSSKIENSYVGSEEPISSIYANAKLKRMNLNQQIELTNKFLQK